MKSVARAPARRPARHTVALLPTRSLRWQSRPDTISCPGPCAIGTETFHRKGSPMTTQQGNVPGVSPGEWGTAVPDGQVVIDATTQNERLTRDAMHEVARE